jgi:RAT1-interacting protein
MFKKDEGITFLLKWILGNRNAFEITDPQTQTTQPLTTLSTDFVCFRGLCTTIMCTPYERRDGWQLFAVKHKGTIYLRQMDTEAKMKAEANQSDHQLRMSSWGFKFEQYSLDDLRKVTFKDS